MPLIYGIAHAQKWIGSETGSNLGLFWPASNTQNGKQSLQVKDAEGN